MLQAIKHIATIALCLLVISGAVGTHVYVFGCANGHHALRISLSGEDKCCCRAHSHDDTCAHEHDSDEENTCTVSIDESCCTTVSQVFNVSNFEVSQVTKLSKAAVAATLFDMCCTCNGECCHALGVALVSSIVHSPPSPDILSFGQLRL